MQVHTGRWRTATGWDAPLPDWDGPATLVMAWGSSTLLDDPGPLPEFAVRFPRSVVVGCSAAGAILGDSPLMTR